MKCDICKNHKLIEGYEVEYDLKITKYKKWTWDKYNSPKDAKKGKSGIYKTEKLAKEALKNKIKLYIKEYQRENKSILKEIKSLETQLRKLK